MTQEKFQLELWLLLLIGQLLCNWTLEQFDWWSTILNDHGVQTNLSDMIQDEIEKVFLADFSELSVSNLTQHETGITAELPEWARLGGLQWPRPRLQTADGAAHSADNISLWLSGVNTSPVPSAGESQVTSPDLRRSCWAEVMMCLRVGVCVTNGLLLPGYLRLAMELQRPVLTNIAGTMLRASACPAQPASASLRPASLC